MINKYWGIKKRNYKNKKNKNNDEEENEPILPLIIKTNSTNFIHTTFNHIYFSNEITAESTFELIKELKNVETNIKTLIATIGIDKIPIYLHLTTDGGIIHYAMSVIDCIKSLSVPVYTVVSGFVASAGTLISLAGEKKYMCNNAYMLIHELRGGTWGKMSEIEDEFINAKKLTKHIIDIYTKNTKLTKKDLDIILKKDLIWDIEECIERGLIDEKFI
jgi:ATP-dependent protease ClpP protease subunit